MNSAKKIILLGYMFQFVQIIQPERSVSGKIRKYYPYRRYRNKKGLALSKHGIGPFCRFSIQAEALPGVYLLVVNGKIIYIGETVNLAQRFNSGYGHISPRGCFVPGGQITNCNINRAILCLTEEGKAVKLYFYETNRHKYVEYKILREVELPVLNAKR